MQLEPWRAVIYAFGCAFEACVSATVMFFSVDYLMGIMSAQHVAIVLFFASAMDAMSSPLIGYLSDNTNPRACCGKKNGRRRPWLFIAIIPAMLYFVLIWSDPVPPLSGESANAITMDYMLMYSGLYTCMAIIKINYDALTSEMTVAYEDRTKLVFLTTLVYVFAASMCVIFLYLEGSDLAARMRAVWIITAVCAPFYVIMVFFSRERPSAQTIWNASDWLNPYTHNIQLTDVGSATSANDRGEETTVVFPAAEQSFIAHARYFFCCMARDYSRILRNRQFVLLGVTGMLISMVITIMQSNLVLYIKYAGGGSNEFVLIIVRMQCGLLIGLFATASTANYMDKRMFLAFALFVWAMVLITINFSGGMPTPAHEIVFGACAGVAMVMIDAMLPDVIDVATDRRSGASRPDALYYAWFGVFQKLGAGIAMSMLAAIVGANTGDAISASDDAYIRALKIVYTTVSPAVLLLSLVPLYFYKITRDTQLRAIGESANTPNIVNDEIVDL